MPDTKLRHTPEEIACLNTKVFDRQVRPVLRPEDDGKFSTSTGVVVLDPTTPTTPTICHC